MILFVLFTTWFKINVDVFKNHLDIFIQMHICMIVIFLVFDFVFVRLTVSGQRLEWTKVKTNEKSHGGIISIK